MRKAAAWRHILLEVSLGMVVVLWIAMLIEGKEFGEKTVFASVDSTAAWLTVLVATAFVVVSVYGTIPDRLLSFIPIGVLFNTAGSSVMLLLGLPFYGDALGTMLVAIVSGPVAGAAAALITTLLWGVGNPDILPHALLGVAAALAAGLLARYRRLSTVNSVVLVGVLLGLVLGLLSAASVTFALGGELSPGMRSLADFFTYQYVPESKAILFQSLVSVVLDIVFALLLATLIVRFAPDSIRGYFTYWGNADRLKLILREQGEWEVADAAAEQNRQINAEAQRRV